MSESTNLQTVTPTAVVADPPTEAASIPPAEGQPRDLPSQSIAKPDAATRSSGVWSSLWLTDRDVAVFTALAILVLVLLVARWAQLSGWGRHEIEIERLTPIAHAQQLDLNEVTWVELVQFEGIGESLAVRIVEDRETHGPFRSVDDLDRVKGIGPKTLERLRPYLTVETANEGL
ncbi:MAG: helix-hairpin-helix domain-containing protein [Planctomycetaceae bacterium]